MQQLHEIINMAGQRGISDIHVRPNDGIWTVKQGALSHFTDDQVQADEPLIRTWLFESGSGDSKTDDPFGARGHAFAAFDTGLFRVRGTFKQSILGTSATFRLIPSEVPNADAIGVPQVVQDLMKKRSGLILVEGPTGSGKTTAIAALIDLLNRTSSQHIYLVEHPIEFVHTQDRSMFTQREIGIHAPDYATAIEDALRSKPNVIVIGEMLNPATARAALHAATTGHLVITTAHAGSVTEAIDSFIGQFTADEQPQIRSRLSQSLLAILVQKLVPASVGGLIPVRELMINNPNFTEIIKTGQMHMIRSQMEGSPNMFSVEDSLAQLVIGSQITEEVAFAEANSNSSLKEKLERRR